MYVKVLRVHIRRIGSIASQSQCKNKWILEKYTNLK